MALQAVFERFKKKSPLTVMARLLMQQALSRQWVDEPFEQHRDQQYTRELLFSTVVDLMALVALGLKPSLHAAAQASAELGVSLTALYDKVNRTEPPVVQALVRGCGEKLTPVVQSMKAQQTPWAAGYRVRVLDGNHLAASEKRLKPLRGFRGGGVGQPESRAPGFRCVRHDVQRSGGAPGGGGDRASIGSKELAGVHLLHRR
ncbi:Mobile element protein [Cystobacter fuscus DSM 2262]|uniref:Mobile element protein n=1 Tax=Cystobacter fuscus (strain ATCC 25194 / DSM 2262 / NBRC 100088 / M29) TaxID=1242864 RepID=S9PKU6_CYSF2|nr:Mobile element protein [Cystobacter fuscus DSM 2262]